MNEQLIEFCPPSSTYIHKNNRFRNFRHNALIDISQSKEEIIMDIKSEVKLQIDLFLDLMPLILEMAFSVKLEIFRVISFGCNDYQLYIFDFLNNCYFLFPLSHCLQFKCRPSKLASDL